MKLNIPTTQSSYNLLRNAGYAIFRDPNTRKTSYTRRLGSGFYPRFHIYVNKEDSTGVELNLHFDQKHASYKGHTAHSGEYDSDLVKQEAKRLARIANQSNLENPTEPKKKGFFAKLFGR